jgi:Fur family ferric uptake transcriptional regulator
VSCEDQAADLLRRAGHKMTPQRMLILRALRHAQGHVSAGQIAEEVKAVYPYVDVSTVYRTLDVLKRLRLATATDMGGGDYVFEWAPDGPHHHLICSTCGQTQELEHRYLEKLEADLVADFRFAPDLHHFAIFGLCADCRTAAVE